MATRDQWGRNIGVDLSVSEMARQMNSPTTNQVDTSNAPSTSNEVWNKLYEAVNSMATRADANASADLNQAERWANQLIDFTKSFKKSTKNDRKEEQTNDLNSRYLEKIAEANQSLMYGSQSQQPMWVGILKITGQAQKDIANAIRLSGCCGVSKDKLSGRSEVFSSRNKTFGVSQASQSALGGKGGIMRDVIDSSNFGGNNDGGSNGGSGGNNGNNNGGMFGGPDDAGGEGLDPSKLASRWFAVAGALQFVGGTIERIHRGLINGLNIEPMSHIFDGAIKNSNTFRESIRATIHEQQGFGATNRAIEESYRDIDNHVLASGVERSKYQEIYLKNLDRGLGLLSESEKMSVKGLKLDKQEAALIKMKTDRMQAVQTTALSTAKALHMSADATNDMFMNWHMHIGMSETSLGEMGRHMQNVARSTGITGAQMESAMRSAEGVVKNLKRAGVASVDSVKSVTEFMAAAQKHGFEGAADMLNAMGSREGFLESKSSMFLMNSARQSGNPNQVNDLLMGRALSTPNGMKDQMKGQEAFTRKLFGNFQTQLSSVGVDANKIDAGNLSEVIQKLMKGDNQAVAAANSLQMMFKGLGMEIGEAEQAFKAMQEASLNPLERIEKYGKDLEMMRKQGLSQTDEYSRMQTKLIESQTNLSMDAFGRMNKFSEQIAANGGVISAELRTEMSKELSGAFGSEQGADAWLKDLSKNTEAAINQVNERAKTSGVDLNDLLNKRGVSGTAELSKLLKAGDIKGTRVLQESLQELGREEKTNQDPVTEIRDTLYELNNRLGGWLDKLGFGLGGLTVKLVYYGGFIAGILLDVLAAIAIAKGVNALMGVAGFKNFGALFTRLGGILRTIFVGGISGITRIVSALISGIPRILGGLIPMFRNILSSLPSIIGRIGPIIGRALGGITRIVSALISGIPRILGGLIPMFRNILSSLPSIIGRIGPIVGRVLGPLAVLGGAIKGYFEAEEAGRTRTEGVILGALTGGAKTGSMFSESLGIEKGSTADKTLGIAGATAWGAAAGAAIGAVFFGVGAVPGAIIGGAIAGVAELIKVISEGTTAISNLLAPVQTFVDIFYDFFKNIGGILYGIITLDIGQIFSSAFDLVKDLVVDVVSFLFSGFTSLYGLGQIFGIIIKGIGKALWKGLTAVFVEFPSWIAKKVLSAFDFVSNIGGWIKNGLASLADNEWVGPIFETLGSIFKPLYDGWMAIYTPIKDGFNAIFNIIGSIGTFFADMFDPVIKFFTGSSSSSKEWTLLGTVMSALQITVHVLSQAVSLLIKPFVWLAKIIGFLAKIIGKVVKSVMTSLVGIAQMVQGIFTLDFSKLKEGMANLFNLPIKDALYSAFVEFPAWLGKKLLDGLYAVFVEFPMWLGKKLLDGLYAVFVDFPIWLGEKLLDGLTAVFVDFPIWLYDTITSGLADLGTWLYDNTIGVIIDAIPDWVKNLFGEAQKEASVATEQSAGEQWNHMLEKGPGFGHAAGSMYAGLGDVANGNILSGAGKLGVGALEGVGATGSAVMSILNPLNWFEEGTRSIEQGGVAVLHKGEMVVPANVWEKVKAVGSGPFGGGSDIIQGFKDTTASSPSKAEGSDGNVLLDLLKEMLSVLKTEKATTVSASLEGAFEDNQSNEAMSSGLESSIKWMPFNISEMAGLFELFKSSGPKEELNGTSNTVTESLKNSITSSTKNSITSTSLEGAFEGNQSNEAMSSVIESSIKYMSYTVSQMAGLFELFKSTSSNETGKAVTESLKDSIVSSSKNVFASTSLEGAFSSGESRSAIDSSMSLETSKLFTNASNPTIDSLTKSVSEVNRQSTGELRPSNLGLFDSSQSKEAQDMSGINALKVTNSDLNNVVNSAISENKGNSVNDSKAKNIVVEVSRALDYEKSASEIANETTASKFSNSIKEKNIVAEVSRALDYEKSASEIASETQASQFYDRNNSSSNVSTNLLDYREAIKGEVGTLGLSRTTLESVVGQEHYGSQPSGNSSIMPSMDAIAEYLVVSQAHKLDQMVEHLAAIRDKMSSGATGTQIIGSSVGGSGKQMRSGVKNIARDLTRGHWDLTYGDYSPGAVTTDGRGGSA